MSSGLQRNTVAALAEIQAPVDFGLGNLNGNLRAFPDDLRGERQRQFEFPRHGLDFCRNVSRPPQHFDHPSFRILMTRAPGFHFNDNLVTLFRFSQILF